LVLPINPLFDDGGFFSGSVGEPSVQTHRAIHIGDTYAAPFPVIKDRGSNSNQLLHRADIEFKIRRILPAEGAKSKTLTFGTMRETEKAPFTGENSVKKTKGEPGTSSP